MNVVNCSDQKEISINKKKKSIQGYHPLPFLEDIHTACLEKNAKYYQKSYVCWEDREKNLHNRMHHEKLDVFFFKSLFLIVLGSS